MTQILRFFLFLFILSVQAYATESLRFIGDVDFTTGAKFLETEIGGLSGITFDKQQNKILAVSDDKSWVNEARFYEFDISLSQKAFNIIPSKVVKLKKMDSKFFQKDEADFEGISLYKGNILISSEGFRNQASPTSSHLYQFSRDGVLQKFITVPEKFQVPSKDFLNSSGTRDNKGFETLSTALDGKTTMLAAEDALLQDGEIASLTNASTTRIIIYKNLIPVSEVAYTLEKLENSSDTTTIDLSDNGLVDIAALDDKNFYALERMWISGINKNIIRIYKCKITTKTTNVSKLKSLKSQSFKAVEKVLVADLEDFVDLITLKKLDNIEGISFGPKLTSGAQTLILVSDNNFNPKQRTLFLAFEILKK